MGIACYLVNKSPSLELVDKNTHEALENLVESKKYVETILKRFNMKERKLVKVPIHVGVKLSTDQCPKTHEEEEDMYYVPYASVFSSLMYAMICTR